MPSRRWCAVDMLAVPGRGNAARSFRKERVESKRRGRTSSSVYVVVSEGMVVVAVVDDEQEEKMVQDVVGDRQSASNSQSHGALVAPSSRHAGICHAFRFWC